MQRTVEGPQEGDTSSISVFRAPRFLLLALFSRRPSVVPFVWMGRCPKPIRGSWKIAALFSFSPSMALCGRSFSPKHLPASRVVAPLLGSRSLYSVRGAFRVRFGSACVMARGDVGLLERKLDFWNKAAELRPCVAFVVVSCSDGGHCDTEVGELSSASLLSACSWNCL